MLELELPCGCVKQFNRAHLSSTGRTIFRYLCDHGDRYKTVIVAERVYTITATKEDEDNG